MDTDGRCRICMRGDRLQGLLIAFVLIETIMPLMLYLCAYLRLRVGRTSTTRQRWVGMRARWPPTTAALKAVLRMALFYQMRWGSNSRSGGQSTVKFLNTPPLQIDSLASGKPASRSSGRINLRDKKGRQNSTAGMTWFGSLGVITAVIPAVPSFLLSFQIL